MPYTCDDNPLAIDYRNFSHLVNKKRLVENVRRRTPERWSKEKIKLSKDAGM